MIQKSFLKCCITNALDGTEDDDVWEIIYQKRVLRVSSGVPNTKKKMKARGRRPSAFIVSRCLGPLMKHEARVFGMAS